MKQRYGDFVHYQPPFQLSTIWLWLAPLLLLLGLFVFMFRRKQAPAEVVAATELDVELQKMIDAVTVKVTDREQSR